MFRVRPWGARNWSVMGRKRTFNRPHSLGAERSRIVEHETLLQVANLSAISSPALNGGDGTGFRDVERGTMGFGSHGLRAPKESDYMDRLALGR